VIANGIKVQPQLDHGKSQPVVSVSQVTIKKDLHLGPWQFLLK